jgi:hypothetical protein
MRDVLAVLGQSVRIVKDNDAGVDGIADQAGDDGAVVLFHPERSSKEVLVR